jgi:anti-anti-sigma factor
MVIKMVQNNSSNTCILNVHGSDVSCSLLTYVTSNRCFDGFYNEIKNNNAKTIILNLLNIDFVDSSGIVLIVQLYKLCKKLDRQLCICCKDEKIKNLLHVTNLDKIIPIIESLR